MCVTTPGSADDTAVRPFTIEIPEAEVEDLRARIVATRFPEKEPVDDASPGVQLATMRELVRYWGTQYDLRGVERRLNARSQFMTEIDGLDIHFIHVKSPHENALPVIMIHGWPGSLIEMLKVVGPLTDPTAHGGSAVAQLAAADDGRASRPGRMVPLGFAEPRGVVSHTQEAAQCGRRARIVKAHPIAGPDGEAEIEALDDRARRW